MRHIILLVIFLISCSPADNNPYNPEKEQTKVSIAYLRSLYSGSVTRIDTDIYIEGHLISNDTEGNNYHILTLQDNTAGIDIKVDLDDSHHYFTTFDCYKLNLKGLCIGGSSDNVNIGISSGYYYTEDLPSNIISSCISKIYNNTFDFNNVYSLNATDLIDRYLGCYIKLSNISYAYNEDHYLTCLNSQRKILLDVSSYAVFHDALTQLSGRCIVLGVLGKSDGEYSIRPSFASDIIFL